jgi:hypothetical protein
MSIKPGYTVTNLPYFRDNTAIKTQKLAFKFSFGGVGDYIHWSTAIRFAIEKLDYIEGLIVTPEYFSDLAHLWFDSYAPRFKIHVSNVAFGELPEIKEYMIKSPTMWDNVDSLGHSLMQLGFSYYLNMDYIPQGWNRLPEIKGDEANISKFNLPSSYAVVTVASTATVRTLPPKTINEISRHLVSIGVTPVFLGRSQLNHDYKATTSEEIDFSLGLDLIEKTTLREAACILAKSKVVVGLDNGLLHLAMCSDVPVIIAFTTVEPRHRLAPRKGKTAYIVPPEELKCRFCQSRMRFLNQHDFRNCFYKDNLCCEMLPSDTFIKTINAMLGE